MGLAAIGTYIRIENEWDQLQSVHILELRMNEIVCVCAVFVSMLFADMLD